MPVSVLTTNSWPTKITLPHWHKKWSSSLSRFTATPHFVSEASVLKDSKPFRAISVFAHNVSIGLYSALVFDAKYYIESFVTTTRIRNAGKMHINTGHRKDAIFTGLRTAAELPTLNLNDTTYAGFVCFREDAGLSMSVVGVVINRPKKSTAGCFGLCRCLSRTR